MDLEGNNYFLLTIDLDYKKEYIKIYMPNYTPKYLKHFLHPAQKKPCYTTHKFGGPSYNILGLFKGYGICGRGEVAWDVVAAGGCGAKTGGPVEIYLGSSEEEAETVIWQVW